MAVDFKDMLYPAKAREETVVQGGVSEVITQRRPLDLSFGGWTLTCHDVGSPSALYRLQESTGHYRSRVEYVRRGYDFRSAPESLSAADVAKLAKLFATAANQIAEATR